MKKRLMHRQFGSTDVEHVALELYKTFHDDKNDDLGWTPYKKYPTDFVVKAFREMALSAVQEHDVFFSDIGHSYYMDEP